MFGVGRGRRAAPRVHPGAARGHARRGAVGLARRRQAAAQGLANRGPQPKRYRRTYCSGSAAMATLHINSDVAGAQVFIDRNYIGVTPVTSPEIAPGSHRVNIVAQGFESIAENVDVEPGSRDLQFNFKEVRLDAAIDVVHKHRFGSCKGRLVATPKGLRYESDDKDDRFMLALTDLDTPKWTTSRRR